MNACTSTYNISQDSSIACICVHVHACYVLYMYMFTCKYMSCITPDKRVYNVHVHVRFLMYDLCVLLIVFNCLPSFLPPSLPSLPPSLPPSPVSPYLVYTSGAVIYRVNVDGSGGATVLDSTSQEKPNKLGIDFDYK